MEPKVIRPHPSVPRKKDQSGWFEYYVCGCVSDLVEDPEQLPSFCERHGTPPTLDSPHYVTTSLLRSR